MSNADFYRNRFLGMCKAGFAGDDAPRAVFPSIVGRPRHQVSTRDCYSPYHRIVTLFMVFLDVLGPKTSKKRNDLVTRTAYGPRVF